MGTDRTFHLPQAAVHFHDLMTSGPSMQPVYVLRNQKKIRNMLFHLGQGDMRRVRLTFLHLFPPPVVELPHQLRVLGERIGTRQIFGPMRLPQTINPPKRRHTASAELPPRKTTTL